MDVFLASIEILMRWDVILALLTGSVGGVLIGAIPGVGPAVAIAILLPATFSMDPIVGLTVLLGIYGSSMYGGAIPTILINTPGTAVNALTTYDGFPMTSRGEARRALSLAYSASFFGGVFSVLCLILFAPVLARIAPMFGSREIFLAALLGIILVVTAHRRQTLIAAALACFGIFINSIGMEAVKYTKRYTFDQAFLSSGINLIVVVLGLFALSQAFYLLQGEDEKNRITKLKGGLFQGLRELGRHPRVATVSASFGVLMGMIPGVGEFTAQFLSYTYAQKTSKRPEDFGQGSSEGLIAAETSNNAVPAAAMVPLLALGIPGDAITAVMLATLTLHGVTPGIRLMADNPVLIAAIFSGFFVINLLLLPMGMLVAKGAAPLLRLREGYMLVLIVLLCAVGVYFVRGNPFDLMVMGVAGVLGFILRRQGMPMPPLVIGMVLGPTLEISLRQGLIITDGSFMAFFTGHPIALVLVICAGVMVCLPLIRAVRARLV